MLMIMIKHQPGSRKEKEALLQQIQEPPQSEKKEEVLCNLKLWKRRIESAKELNISVPDPSILLKALNTITAKVIGEDPRRAFRIESAREEIGIDTITTIEAVNKLALLVEWELEESTTSLKPTVPEVKSTKGKGKKGKGKDSR